MENTIKDAVIQAYSKCADKSKFVRELRSFIHKELSPQKTQPVDNVMWVPLDQVTPNDYNPNSVAGKEMHLLYTSILHDGYTQPIVTIWDEVKSKWVIVDGFHRYYICKNHKDILERNNGLLPIVVINKSINERMAATVRHNRARGKHMVTGMSSMVLSMLRNGMSDAEVCNELGLEPEELIKLKHVTGIARLFANAEYGKAWETTDQVKIRKAFEASEQTE